MRKKKGKTGGKRVKVKKEEYQICKRKNKGRRNKKKEGERRRRNK
jgi:hypothetical protein